MIAIINIPHSFATLSSFSQSLQYYRTIRTLFSQYCDSMLSVGTLATLCSILIPYTPSYTLHHTPYTLHPTPHAHTPYNR
jgi:hypothetical protein